MLKKGIFSKIFGLMVLTSLVIGIVIIAVTIKERRQDSEKGLVQENKLLAETASTIVEAVYLEHILPFKTLRRIADAENTSFLWIVKPNGEIFYADDPKMFGKIIVDLSLGTEEVVVKDSISPKDGKKIKLIVSPVKIEFEKKPWNLYLGVSLEAVSEDQRRIISTSLVFFAMVIIVILLISFYLAKGITNPLKNLRKGAEIIGKGNLDYQIKLKTGDEIEELAESFNQMAKNLGEAQTALEESKIVLEIKIRARTKELRELTESLDEQVKERTKALQKKIEELEKFHRLAVGRELKMIELKKEIENLKKELEKYTRLLK